ncbi:cache domain-containing sensor histidine kinase [Paenibacillus sp. y28]|uniref:cache domain-containing sensor histidine kinase n=1 Tax=Paenibacillus sp. y28 TaxID=3129110 RepID=UPI003019FC2C
MSTWLNMVRRARFRGLQARIVILFSLVLLVAISSTGLLYYWSTIREIKSQTLSLSENTVDQMKLNIGFFLENADRLSMSVFGDYSVQRVLRTREYASEAERQQDVSEMNFRLLSYSSPWNQVQGMYVFSTDGRLYYSVKGKSPRLDYRMEDEPWYPAIAAGSTKALLYWPSGPETTVYGQAEHVFSLIRPIIDFPVANVLGYMKIDIKLKGLEYVLGQDENGPTSFSSLYIVREDGHVIYDQRGERSGIDRGLEQFAKAGSSSGEAEWDGSRTLYVTRPLKGVDWTLVAFVPYDGIVQKMNETGKATFLIGVAAIVVVVLIAYFISAGITRPLRLLMRNMQKVEMGNFKVRLDSSDNDEVGRLNRMFNDMVQNVELLIKEVYESKIREKDARLLALQTQVNPHFLFNTLNVIRAISRRRGAPEVGEVIDSLAEMFRYSMKEWDRTVPLSVELKYLNHYFRIQQVRFHSRITFTVHIPPECMDGHVVKLSLQPIVENAFKHGVEMLESGACIRVFAEVREGLLLIGIADNGEGIAPERLELIQRRLAAPSGLLSVSAEEADETSGNGIGLFNIDRRMKLFFGDEYGIQLASGPEGTIVTMRQPYLPGGREAG